MTLRSAIIRLLAVIPVGMVLAYFRIILGWFEKRFAPPYMKERVNSGSDRFFEQEDKLWGRTEIDSLLRGEYDDL
jgi:hypothetical protein